MSPPVNERNIMPINIQTLPAPPDPDDDDSLMSAPVPAIQADHVVLPDPDFAALHSANRKPDAEMILKGQAENATGKACALLKSQWQGYTKAAAEVNHECREAEKELEQIPPEDPAQPGETGIRWPDAPLDRLLVAVFLVAGVALTGLGWWNSAHICMIFMQNALLSFGFTAPLLFLPAAMHLVTKQLRLRSRFLSVALGIMALSGAFLLVVELAGAARPTADVFDTAAAGPNPLRLLVGQVLLEIASGVLLIQQAEKRLCSSRATKPSARYQIQLRKVNLLKRQRDGLAEKAALVRAELKAIETKANDWVQRHLVRWENRAA
jgi:hypothetical protein